MTTDTVSKYVHARVGNATIVGVAKGVGMIEPNMATMLSFFFTDAALPKATLDRIFRKVVNATFNCLSIDTDTSTSDTAAIFANGMAGAVSENEFEARLHELALALVKKIARDGEGATKLLEVGFGFEHLIPTVELPDPDDRHVLAAAIHGGASLIVIPPEKLNRYNLAAHHPDDFIFDLLDLLRVRESAANYRRSGLSASA